MNLVEHRMFRKFHEFSNTIPKRCSDGIGCSLLFRKKKKYIGSVFLIFVSFDDFLIENFTHRKNVQSFK